MDRVNKIITNPLWNDAILDIECSEMNRVFCRHGIEHFIDVARLMYIENLEENFNIDKEIIYAAALIHDIGRSSKYSKGLDHEEAGALLAEEILKACDFSCEEITMIKEAILAHRNTETKNSDGLNGLLYRADKKSRMCLFCQANEQCKWSEEKMNLKVDI